MTVTLCCCPFFQNCPPRRRRRWRAHHQPLQCRWPTPTWSRPPLHPPLMCWLTDCRMNRRGCNVDRSLDYAAGWLVEVDRVGGLQRIQKTCVTNVLFSIFFAETKKNNKTRKKKTTNAPSAPDLRNTALVPSTPPFGVARATELSEEDRIKNRRGKRGSFGEEGTHTEPAFHVVVSRRRASQLRGAVRS